MNIYATALARIELLLHHFLTRTILYLMDGFLIAAASLVGPIFAVYVEHIGGNIIIAGTAYAVFAVTAGIGVLLFSRFEDNTPNLTTFIAVGYLLASIAYFFYIFISSPVQLLIAQAILGLAAAVRVPAYDVFLSKHALKHPLLAWGYWNATVYLVSAFSAVVGAALATAFGFRTMLVIIFLLSLVSFFLSVLIIKVHFNEAIAEE